MRSKSNTQFNKDTCTYKGQRKFTAKNEAYSFDLFDDEWQINMKVKVKLDWMHDVGFDEQSFIYLRLVFAKYAGINASSTALNAIKAMKTLNTDVTEDSLRRRWSVIKDSYKATIVTFLKFAITHGFDDYKSAADFASDQTKNAKSNLGATLLDPYKGVYSEFEYQSIQEQIRRDTSERLTLALDKSKVYTVTKLHQLSTTLAIQLMVAIMRRPTQLIKTKWCDFLPVGLKFADHRVNQYEEIPTHEATFSDVDVLNIRTFRGKNGEFRVDAEPRSHRLEPDLSRLVMLYRQKYETLLTKKLSGEGIDLTSDELKEVMNRLPVFFSEELFSPSTIFKNKTTLFKATGRLSQSFHKAYLTSVIYKRMTDLNLASDRIDDETLKLSNNRHRHHVLTEAVMRGDSIATIASITGVTLDSIKPYIELNFEARLKIDQALANNQVLSKFSSQSVSELQQQSGFIVLSEFEEELGIQKNPSSCNGCQSKLAAPMGCYGCDNFYPDLHADHQQILDKATAKYEANLAASNKEMLRKLSKSILYIKATITVCHDKIKSEMGVRDERN